MYLLDPIDLNKLPLFFNPTFPHRLHSEYVTSYLVVVRRREHHRFIWRQLGLSLKLCIPIPCVSSTVGAREG